MDRLAYASLYLIPAFWVTWLAIWLAGSWNVKRTQVREPLGGALANRLPVLLGALMLAAPAWQPALLTQRLLWGPAGPAAGTVLVFAGLALSVWARWHLGRNWSSTVTVKEGHTLIRSGPYRWVRHPIYSGMVLALFGSALAIGAPRGFIGAGLILLGFVLKLLAEEARMRDTFPREYAAYCRQTARLIPRVF
ncbi:MAG TPA: isoprenylcysteine carboxylmethyltransferase family protein [Stellaceae bacterium]|nr:isoprenylcysteine carboxylmethyltransferase family protein [Stellaceae bacterium]